MNPLPDLAIADGVLLDETLAGDSAPQPLQVNLVEASGSGLSKETSRILQSRLRTSALILFGGFAAYLALNLFIRQWPDQGFDYLFLAHVVLTVLLAACAASLCRKCQLSSRTLRIQEFLIFGGPAAFFFDLSLVSSRQCAAYFHFLPDMASLWLMLIFIYALFIPNTWRRAAQVVGLIVSLRIGLTFYLVYFDPVSSEALNAGFAYVATNNLMMALGAITAIAGVHTIGSLRREAFMAKQLGQYRLRETLGRGGMGEVFLAEHQLMKRPCAIKVIRPEKATDARALARFEREVRAAAALSHWNSIDIYDYGHDDKGTFYYVMEYLPGMNLGDVVKKYGPMPAARVIHLLRQTCDALSEAHQVGLIHRDIKPANIFAAERGGHYDVAKLLDFGLVKPISESANLDLTIDGTLTGSPLYMSPEQAVGDEPDVRSDIYALGAVAYFLLTGRPPFDHAHSIKVLMAHAHESPLPMSKLVPDVPRDLQQIVMRCLAKEPSDRYQSAKDLQAALSNCADAAGWTDQDALSWWTERQAEAHDQEVVESIPASHVAS